MWNRLEIRGYWSSEKLRQLAGVEPNFRAAMRIRAIANALDGMSRSEAAQAVGMSRQALRDAVIRFNAEGIAGLYDRLRPGRPPRLTCRQQRILKKMTTVERCGGPPTRRTHCRPTMSDICTYCEGAFGVSYTEQAMRRLLKRVDG